MSYKIVVDPIGCVGHRLCADLLPERITLDDWGFPIVDTKPIPQAMLRDARRAVDACPTLALRLERVQTQRVPRRNSTTND